MSGSRVQKIQISTIQRYTQIKNLFTSYRDASELAGLFGKLRPPQSVPCILTERENCIQPICGNQANCGNEVNMFG